MTVRRHPRWLLVAVGAGLALIVVSVRLLHDSRSALHAGEMSEARGDRLEAIRHYQDAARLYLPASPYVRDALNRLEALATAAAQAGDGPSVRAALEAERAAILATRSLYIPSGSRLPNIERRLAQVLAATEDRSVAPGASFEARTAWHLERLARRPGPALAHVLLALAGLVLWVGSAIGFVSRGLDPKLRLRRRNAAIAGVTFALGLAMFLVGLRFA
ncbi:MAG TPA: hypothetical protein VJ801_00680 [Polyangia bacterium]|jgi:hypothetical protein|nr:hypothetical protein [Polyangia bacterium]